MTLCTSIHHECRKQQLLLKLKEYFTQQWNLDVYNDNKPGNQGNKLRTYRKFKSDISLEPYLLLLPENTRKTLTRLRISDHNFYIETGRHHRSSPIAQERLCTLCNSGFIEHEFHVLMSCTKFKTARVKMLNQLYEIFPTLYNTDEETIFIFIMQCQTHDLSKCLGEYLKYVEQIRGCL